MENQYTKIIPTAWIVAYRRKYSNIPFSSEIFKELDKLREERFSAISDQMLATELSPQYEARHKIIDKYIALNHPNQILEIASGFSSRGLTMAENSNVVYVEFDLPRVIEDKINIVNSILNQLGQTRPNLYFEKGSALDYDLLFHAVKHFKKEPITIVNEGFLRYLNFKEKETVAKNIHKLLKIYGGLWITSDITLKKLLKVEEDLKLHKKTIAKIAGIDVDKNRFEDENQAKAFFENLGFSIERHSFMEVKENLVSPKKLNSSDSTVNKLLDSAVIYIMRVKN